MVKREGGHTVELFTSEGGRKGHWQVGRVSVQSALLTKATTKWQNRVVVKVTPPLAMVHHVTLPSISEQFMVFSRLVGHGQAVGAVGPRGPRGRFGLGGRGQAILEVGRPSQAFGRTGETLGGLDLEGHGDDRERCWAIWERCMHTYPPTHTHTHTFPSINTNSYLLCEMSCLHIYQSRYSLILQYCKCFLNSNRLVLFSTAMGKLSHKMAPL